MRSFRLGLLPFTASASSELVEVKQYEKSVQKLASKLAVYADFSLLVLGGKLKQAELLSARLGDVMSYLYLFFGISVKVGFKLFLENLRGEGCPLFSCFNFSLKKEAN